MAVFLGGVKKYGEDTPIPLDKILDVCGLDAALWCLRCIIEPADREIRLLACDFAEHTLPIFEKRYPDDRRPRKAVEVARKFAEGKATKKELIAAWAAAWAAAGDAAGAAAWDAARAAAGAAAWAAARDAAWATAGAAAGDAAWDAAYTAESQWQEQKFREMLNNSGI